MMFPPAFVSNNGSLNRHQRAATVGPPRVEPVIIPPPSPENLSPKQVHHPFFQQQQQRHHCAHANPHHHVPPFFGRSPGAPPMTPIVVSPVSQQQQHHPMMGRLAASDDELMRMEQEVEASHMAARFTLARMRAARAAQISRQQDQEQLHHQQQQQQHQHQLQYQNHRAMALNQFQPQHQHHHQAPRIVSPVKQARPQNKKASGAPSLPGLDLLHTASLSVASEATSSNPPSTLPLLSRRPSTTGGALISSAPPMPIAGVRREVSQCSISSCNNSACNHSATSSTEEPLASGASRIYIVEVRPTDILCGRGGRSNHHPGNKRYRQIVGNIKFAYQQCPAKTLKTDLSRAIIESCYSYGARFIKQESNDGRYYVLTKAEARKKTSQALRETKALKWTH